VLAVTLGPLAFPLAPLLVLGAIVAAVVLGRQLAPAGQASRAESAIGGAALAGLLAARLGHLAVHASAYAAQPLAVFDIRDGGWMPGLGWAAAAAWLLWRASRWPAGRRTLGAGAAAGVLVWGGAQVALLARSADPAAAAVPPIALLSLDGQQALTLPTLLAGRPAVVNLWASWCAPCRVEMPVFAAAQRAEPEVLFVFVNQGETAEAVQRYLAREGLALEQVWLDPASALGPAVGSTGLPTTLFFDAEGRRVDAHFGVLNAPALQVRLRRLQR
jgi:thiol-disulfide isomerase/thioredoxin